ncbi:MAG: hypothetical protein D3910_06235 [Candidatus Electrothrix sp. ATG2]|nr:hypothetical protein [Candidatus Electrothrix sp. ATG2]
MNETSFEELEELVHAAISARTKKDAQKSINQLESKVLRMRGSVDRYLSEKLNQLVTGTKRASG